MDDKIRFQKFQFPYFGDKEELKHVAATFEPLVPDEPAIDPEEEERERQVQARIDQAREEAYARGVEAGRQQGAEAVRAELEPKHQQEMQAVISEHQNALKQLVANIEQQIVQAGLVWSDNARLEEGEMIHLAWALARRLVGDALQGRPEDVLMPALEEMLSEIRQSSTLTIRVNPAMVSEVTEQLTRLSEKHQLGLNCIGDEAMALTDADLLWDGGHASHRLEHLCQRMEDALSIRTELLVPSPKEELVEPEKEDEIKVAEGDEEVMPEEETTAQEENGDVA